MKSYILIFFILINFSSSLKDCNDNFVYSLKEYIKSVHSRVTDEFNREDMNIKKIEELALYIEKQEHFFSLGKGEDGQKYNISSFMLFIHRFLVKHGCVEKAISMPENFCADAEDAEKKMIKNLQNLFPITIRAFIQSQINNIQGIEEKAEGCFYKVQPFKVWLKQNKALVILNKTSNTLNIEMEEDSSNSTSIENKTEKNLLVSQKKDSSNKTSNTLNIKIEEDSSNSTSIGNKTEKNLLASQKKDSVCKIPLKENKNRIDLSTIIEISSVDLERDSQPFNLKSDSQSVDLERDSQPFDLKSDSQSVDKVFSYGPSEPRCQDVKPNNSGSYLTFIISFIAITLFTSALLYSLWILKTKDKKSKNKKDKNKKDKNKKSENKKDKNKKSENKKDKNKKSENKKSESKKSESKKSEK